MALPPRIANALPKVFRAFLSLPPTVLTRLAGGPTVIDGNTLDTQLGVVLVGERLIKLGRAPDLRAARAGFDAQMVLVAPDKIDMRTEEYRIPTTGGAVAARLYVPNGLAAKPPLLVFFHGGGFVLGGLESHDRAVREIAESAGTAVLAVDYRLAPEHRTPDAIEDAFDAYSWAREHASELGVDATRIGAGGDSAGGNLTACLTHVCKDRGVTQPIVQWLVYPAVDLTTSFRSHDTFAKGFILDRERIAWFLDQYVRSEADKTNPLVSPYHRADFSGLAPAIILTAGFDPLRDEGRAYGDKLEAAGVRVQYHCAPSMIHGFMNMTGAIQRAREELASSTALLRDALRAPIATTAQPRANA